MLLKNHPNHNARSAGTSDKARIRVNKKLLLWADVIFVMERRHKQLLRERFASALAERQVIILEIADDYPFGDAELIEILKEKLIDYL